VIIVANSLLLEILKQFQPAFHVNRSAGNVKPAFCSFFINFPGHPVWNAQCELTSGNLYCGNSCQHLKEAVVFMNPDNNAAFGEISQMVVLTPEMKIIMLPAKLPLPPVKIAFYRIYYFSYIFGNGIIKAIPPKVCFPLVDCAQQTGFILNVPD
jgi:hypothetical protein